MLLGMAQKNNENLVPVSRLSYQIPFWASRAYSRENRKKAPSAMANLITHLFNLKIPIGIMLVTAINMRQDLMAWVNGAAPNQNC